MIAPTYRLALLAALIGVPAGLGYAAAGDGLVLGGFIALIGVLFALLDAILAPRRLEGVRFSLPEVARLTVEREGEIEIGFTKPTQAGGRVRIGLDLPDAIIPERETNLVPLPEGESGRIVWPCKAGVRGQYGLAGVYAECTSPGGLWHWRKMDASPCEVRVYPNLMREKSGLAALFLNRGGLGAHAQRQVGKGREFEKLREYQPGDSFEDIHWRATAKRGFPVTKEFQIERTQEVYVVLDASRLSARETDAADVSIGGGPGAIVTHLERFITSALILGMVAEKQHDRFGLCVFSDEVETFVRAESGVAHHRRLRDALYAQQARRVNPDFSEVCTFLRMRLRQRALVLFLTHLDDEALSEQFLHDVQVLSRKHIVMVTVLNTPGAAPVFGADTDSEDGVYRALAAHLRWQKLRETQRALRRRGVNLAFADHATLCPDLVTQYMNVRRRQLL
ncbi:MAG: DUF58 domain-containing protein [Candidatus Hydrogenedens sp.]|nr:DUF58 domain-containing protein [Candidatus Hydrogenedens sp.]